MPILSILMRIMKFNTKGGLSVFAIIALVAIIAVVGIVMIKSSQKNGMMMESENTTSEAMTETKTAVNLKLKELRETLDSDTDSDTNNETLIGIISEIKDTLYRSYSLIEDEHKAEIGILMHRIDELEEQILSASDTLTEELEHLVADINESIENQTIIEDHREELPEGVMQKDLLTEEGSMTEGDDSATEEGTTGVTGEESTNTNPTTEEGTANN